MLMDKKTVGAKRKTEKGCWVSPLADERESLEVLTRGRPEEAEPGLQEACRVLRVRTDTGHNASQTEHPQVWWRDAV